MTKTELLLSMTDAYSRIPIGEEFTIGMADPAILSVLDPSEYEIWTSPGGTPIGYILTETGRTAWAAARA